MSLFENDKSAQRLPVSLITGFLGSGKTTLLNRLLRHDDMKDSAVIINEYGEIALDHLLVERVEGEVAVLASGCICCTIRSDLEDTLRTLLVRRDRGEVPAFRRILVETTGLADPAPIVQLLLNNPLVIQASKDFAKALLDNAESDDKAVVGMAIWRAYGRSPRLGESDGALEYLRSYAAALRMKEPGLSASAARRRAWESYCQALLCSSEFSYID